MATQLTHKQSSPVVKNGIFFYRTKHKHQSFILKICDVKNAEAEVPYTEDNETTELVIDGNLITGKHPGMVDQFMETFLMEMGKK